MLHGPYWLGPLAACFAGATVAAGVVWAALVAMYARTFRLPFARANRTLAGKIADMAAR